MPSLAGIVAAQNLCLRSTGLRRQIAAEFDRVVRSGTHRPVTRPRGGSIFGRAEKYSLRHRRVIGHRNRVSAPHTVLALEPIFSAVVGLIGTNPRASEKGF